MQRRVWRALRVLVFGGLLLAACQAPLPPPPVYREITFTNESPIALNVASIEVDDEYIPPLKRPNVDQEFPVRIAAVARRWAHDRLSAVGGERTARVIIKDASAVAVDLPKSVGLRGAFTNDQAVRYDARVEMIVEIRDDRGFPLATISATSLRSRSVTNDITLNDRDRVFYDMTAAMMRYEAAALARNIHRYMPAYIR